MTASAPDPRLAEPGARGRRTLELTLDGGPHALARIVALCTRRHLTVVALTFVRAASAGRAELCVEGDARRLANADVWLERLVEVLAVRERDPTQAQVRSRAPARPSAAGTR
jgi:acetolactate synthase small subunit